MRAAVNYVTGSHAFKFGMTDMWGTRHYQYDTNQAQSWTFLNGIPTTITEYARPLIDLEHLKAALGLYAQDRWTIDRLTLNLGLRFDYHNAYVPAQDVPADPVRARRAPLRCDLQRPELEGSLAAPRRRRTTSSATARP